MCGAVFREPFQQYFRFGNRYKSIFECGSLSYYFGVRQKYTCMVVCSWIIEVSAPSIEVYRNSNRSLE